MVSIAASQPGTCCSVCEVEAFELYSG